jgi:hypothetical protein
MHATDEVQVSPTSALCSVISRVFQGLAVFSVTMLEALGLNPGPLGADDLRGHFEEAV